jgi:hypothetical protein
MPQNPIQVGVANTSITVKQTVGTITAHTGTYEVALNPNPFRAVGGVIINLGTANMGVQFGAKIGAAISSDVIIAAAGTLQFAEFFPVQPYTGEVVIQGTTLDTFLVIENTGAIVT